MAALHRDVRDPTGSTAAWHGNEIRARRGLDRVNAEIPASSPSARLGLGEPLVGIHPCQVELLLGRAPFLPLQLLGVSPGAAG